MKREEKEGVREQKGRGMGGGKEREREGGRVPIREREPTHVRTRVGFQNPLCMFEKLLGRPNSYLILLATGMAGARRGMVAGAHGGR